MKDYSNSCMGYVIEVMLLYEELRRNGKISYYQIVSKSEFKKIIIDIVTSFKNLYDIDWFYDNGYERLREFAEPILINKFI